MFIISFINCWFIDFNYFIVIIKYLNFILNLFINLHLIIIIIIKDYFEKFMDFDYFKLIRIFIKLVLVIRQYLRAQINFNQFNHHHHLDLKINKVVQLWILILAMVVKMDLRSFFILNLYPKHNHQQFHYYDKLIISIIFINYFNNFICWNLVWFISSKLKMLIISFIIASNYLVIINKNFNFEFIYFKLKHYFITKFMHFINFMAIFMELINFVVIFMEFINFN